MQVKESERGVSGLFAYRPVLDNLPTHEVPYCDRETDFALGKAFANMRI
jgi:hypothetical protein